MAEQLQRKEVMMGKTVFYFQNIILILMGFIMKHLSLKLSGSSSQLNLLKNTVDQFCNTDKMAIEKVCEFKKNISYYNEVALLNNLAIILSLLVLAILIWNQKSKIFPSRLNIVLLVFSSALLIFSVIVTT